MRPEQITHKKKKDYQPPKLISYGQLQELTTGGTGKFMEGQWMLAKMLRL